MGVLELLTTTVGVPLGKFLLKSYLGEPAGAVGGGLLDLAKDKIKDFSKSREAAREIEAITDRVVNSLVPLFNDATKRDLNVEAVAHQLALTLDGHVDAGFFVSRDLDPRRLRAALCEARPLPPGMFSAAETAFYDRALTQTVRYLTEVASNLPRFDEKYAAESLQRLSVLRGDVTAILENVRQIEKLVVAQSLEAGEEAQRYEADYRQAVSRNLDYIELFGADVRPESKRQSLSVAYISLNLGSEDGDEETSTATFETALAKLGVGSGRLIIKGEAGSGKSTLLRWTAVHATRGIELPSFQLASWLKHHGLVDAFEAAVKDVEGVRPPSRLLETLENTSFQSVVGPEIFRILFSRTLTTSATISLFQNFEQRFWCYRIPFLIRLRDCPEGRLPTPDRFPELIAGEIGTPPKQWVTSILDSGRGLVLIDGLDEVPNVHREAARRAIEAIVRRYEGNYFLISARPAAIEEGWFADLGFEQARINPMSGLDRERFIDKWHEAVALELARQGRPADLTALASSLKDKLRVNPPIARLATNPLLCATICALHHHRNEYLPNSQAELCEALCELLMHRRERESGLRLDDFPEPYRSLEYRHKKAIVQDFAHYMVRNEEPTLTRQRALDLTAAALRSFPGRSEADAAVICDGLVERSSVLRKAGRDSIDFIHNTLKEYLAAERFAGDVDAGLLAGRALDAAWQPVVLFAAAKGSETFATALIRKILEPPSGTDGGATARTAPSRERQLMALRCGTVALKLDEALQQRLREVERRIFPPRSPQDAESLADLGDGIVHFLKHRKMPARQAAACVRTLRLIGTPPAREQLRGYLADRRQSVVAELVQAVNPLEVEAVRQRLGAREPLPEDIAKQVSDLAALSSLAGVTVLNLAGVSATDLGPLAGLTALQILWLGNTQVADLGPLAGREGLVVFGAGAKDAA